MQEEPITEELRSQVLQNTLEQISSATEGAPDCCIICLGDLSERCEARPCRHDSFDYHCLITWLQERENCPLCKSHVIEVHYELSENGTQSKVYKLPEQTKNPVDNRAGDGSSRSPPPQLRRRDGYEDVAIRTRRAVYRRNLYSLHVGSNRRQPPATRHREFLTPEMFMAEPELVSRAKMWLRRELRIFEFLFTDGSDSLKNGNPVRRHRTYNEDYLIEYIIAVLKTLDTQGSAGQAEALVREFLGREYTSLFLHELRAWLRSPYGALSAWDRAVEYAENAVP